MHPTPGAAPTIRLRQSGWGGKRDGLVVVFGRASDGGVEEEDMKTPVPPERGDPGEDCDFSFSHYFAYLLCCARCYTVCWAGLNFHAHMPWVKGPALDLQGSRL